MDEHARLASLRSLEILDTPSEEAFDRLTRLAASAIGTPTAITGLVDEARVWLKSKVGTDVSETPLTESFCTHTIAGEGVLVVEDARLDARFSTSILVTHYSVRFYAGAPIALENGHVVGTICVLDTVPRPTPSAAAIALLEGLAMAVGHLLDLKRELLVRRAAERRLIEHARIIELAEEMTGIGTCSLDFATGKLVVSPSTMRIHGLHSSAATPDIDSFLAMYRPADRSQIVELIDRAHTTGHGFACDARLQRGDGTFRDVRIEARCEYGDDGRSATLIAVLRDITDDKKVLEVLKEQRIEADLRARRLSHLASTDLLTGLPNRRAFLERCERILRDATVVSLAILDLDHFKAVNDLYGHSGGDMALSSFGQACALFADQASVFGRIGGEEFALMMIGKEPEDAAIFVEALRRQVSSEALRLQNGIALQLTFSAGLAHVQPGDDWKTLFGRADQALYRAKREGRDRLAIAA